MGILGTFLSIRYVPSTLQRNLTEIHGQLSLTTAR